MANNSSNEDELTEDVEDIPSLSEQYYQSNQLHGKFYLLNTQIKEGEDSQGSRALKEGNEVSQKVTRATKEDIPLFDIDADSYNEWRRNRALKKQPLSDNQPTQQRIKRNKLVTSVKELNLQIRTQLLSAEGLSGQLGLIADELAKMEVQMMYIQQQAEIL